jgi:hypothetical protein
MHLASASGMNELLEFSRRGFVQPLVCFPGYARK